MSYPITCSFTAERFAYVREIVDDKEGLRDELQVWLTFWRDVLVCASGISGSVTNLDHLSQVQKLAKVIELKGAQFHVNAIQRTMERIERNVNTRLALEVMLMDFPRINIAG
jgi:DNA polymerase III gamma/tau subunit